MKFSLFTTTTTTKQEKIFMDLLTYATKNVSYASSGNGAKIMGKN